MRAAAFLHPPHFHRFVHGASGYEGDGRGERTRCHVPKAQRHTESLQGIRERERERKMERLREKKREWTNRQRKTEMERVKEKKEQDIERERD